MGETVQAKKIIMDNQVIVDRPTTIVLEQNFFIIIDPDTGKRSKLIAWSKNVEVYL